MQKLVEEEKSVEQKAQHNRVEAGVSPAPPTPPDMRHRIRRFTNVEQDQSDE